jgi:hypothetical protein
MLSFDGELYKKVSYYFVFLFSFSWKVHNFNAALRAAPPPFPPSPPLFLPKPEPVVTGPQVTPDSGSGINRYNTAQPPFREEVNKLKQKI